MKHLAFSIILSCFIACNLLAQVKIPIGTKKDVSNFYATTTCVVLKNDIFCDYNAYIKEAVKEHWHITPVIFIKESEFNKYKTDPSKSFLMINQVYFEDDKSNTIFDFLVLSNGGNYRSINDMPTLCAIPLCYKGDSDEKYVYKLGVMVKFAQTHMEICKAHPELTNETITDYYINNSGSLDSKKLYILRSEVSEELLRPSDFKNLYPYKYEFSDPETIENLIKNSDKDAVITHIISPLKESKLKYCVKIVIDTEKGMMYYYDTQRLKSNHDGFLISNDLKKLAKK